MDLVLLGVAALVLIALTVWIVWRPGSSAKEQAQPAAQFEDQHTSATADLSAGGVAVATSTTPALPQEPAVIEVMPEPAPANVVSAEQAQVPRPSSRSGPVGIVTAVLLTLGGAVGGAWLYSRWLRERNKPLNRLRRRLR
jgi:hypothetical protein